MDILHLKTFACVARTGSITRAAECLFLSQPAVSAHIKGIEQELGLALFERTARGMRLTSHGQRILAMAEHTIASHRALIDEAALLKGRLAGRLRIGVGGQSDTALIGRLLRRFAEHHPEVEISLEYGSSSATLAAIRSGVLDAGFYNEANTPGQDLATREMARFPIYLAAPASMVDPGAPLDWAALGQLPWIFAPASLCCGGAAEQLFQAHQFRPRRIISIDRDSVMRPMLAQRLGIGLLHGDTALEAQRQGEVDLLCVVHPAVSQLFAHLASRAQEPLFGAIHEALGAASP
ncbi:LysR family transcriptional regulator [Janthinobacterium sp. RB2R34]|uniref:LysR family transcriptional regulator n=1 Tax=Janthinobacterium sp. RB2R34 TaxID=3424193 RepID=UPI003F26E68F